MRTARSSGRAAARVLPAAALALAVVSFVGEAAAIIGRPLTPMSYAGVARRTTRRAVYAGAAYGAAATVAAVPPGCGAMTGYYACGGQYYRPAYDGPNVVYVVSDHP